MRVADPVLRAGRAVVPAVGRARRRTADRGCLYVGDDRRSHVRDRVLFRSPHRGDGADRDRRGLADSHLFDGVHEGRLELRPLLRVSQPVPLLHADAGARQIAARPFRRLGRRGAGVVPAHRILVRRPGQGAGGKEGLHHQPDRRCRLPARHVRALPGVRHARHGPDQRRVHQRCRARRVGEPRRHPAVHRRHRQVGADSAACMAARRDGRPDARLGPHSRGDDGDRRRVPRRPPVGDLRARAGSERHRRRDRRRHRVLCRDHRRRADRHQEGPRVLDDLPARAHVRGTRRRRVRRRHLPSLYARVLQGLPVPGRGQRDPRAGRRAGHPEDGRPRATDSDHLRDICRRHGRHRGHSAAGRLFLEGRNPVVRLLQQPGRLAVPLRGCRASRRC